MIRTAGGQRGVKTSFQFLYGTIMMLELSEENTLSEKFQFLYGTIMMGHGRLKFLGVARFQFLYGTIMIRSKICKKIAFPASKRHL